MRGAEVAALTRRGRQFRPWTGARNGADGEPSAPAPGRERRADAGSTGSPTPRDGDSHDPSPGTASGFTFFRLFPVIPEPT